MAGAATSSAGGVSGLKVGAVFPTNGIGTDPTTIRDFAQAAEALGYCDLMIYDHVVLPWGQRGKPELMDAKVLGTGDFQGSPYSEEMQMHEAMTTLAFFAAVTSRIQLSTSILVAPMRQTALMAKQIAEVAVLSNGRLTVGMATGWSPIEFEAMGVPLEHRGERLEEQIKVIRLMLTEEYIEFSGKFHQIQPCSMNPKPPRPVPFWMGGTAKVGYTRAGALADGFIFHGAPSRPDVQEGFQIVSESRSRAGRDGANFGFNCMVDFSIGIPRWHSEIELWRRMGGTHLAMRSMDFSAEYFGVPRNNFTRPQQYIDALGVFAREVGLTT